MSTHHAYAGVSGEHRTSLPLLTVNEASRFLNVSRWTVYKLVRSGDLRAVRVGERLRFRTVDLDTYLEREPVR